MYVKIIIIICMLITSKSYISIKTFCSLRTLNRPEVIEHI